MITGHGYVHVNEDGLYFAGVRGWVANSRLAMWHEVRRHADDASGTLGSVVARDPWPLAVRYRDTGRDPNAWENREALPEGVPTTRGVRQ